MLRHLKNSPGIDISGLHTGMPCVDVPSWSVNPGAVAGETHASSSLPFQRSGVIPCSPPE